MPVKPSSKHTPPITFQEIISRLQQFWAAKGCITMQPLDLEVGAGTFHPATFLRAIGPRPWAAAYAQACRRPTDGRYGDNPNRTQHYYQFQVIMKPSPDDIQQLYLDSLTDLGIDQQQHDIRFVEDNWESPSLGAWGLGWEVWQDGMEISQFTYFQQIGGLPCRPVTAELTYGLERIAMQLQNVDSMYDIVWGHNQQGPVYYRDIFHAVEQQQSAYNFQQANTEYLFQHFKQHELQAVELSERDLIFPAYEQLLKASHTFNLLDARHAISVTERQGYILRLRKIAHKIAKCYADSESTTTEENATDCTTPKTSNKAKLAKQHKQQDGAT